MKIGIDASRAFLHYRTGVEEYCYQVTKHLRDDLADSEVILYVRRNQKIDFELPKNWSVRIIAWSRFWTQIGLSLELLLKPIDILLVPAHTVPFIHPKKTFVVIHGLEYEVVPEAYSPWERFYMRLSIKNSCRWAETVISVSKNTKEDLMRLYKVPEDKIHVVYEGYDRNSLHLTAHIENKFKSLKPYLVFIGRVEARKNILGMIEAFDILKEEYKIPHKLVFAGRFGHGHLDIQKRIGLSKYREDIVLPGFVRDEEKFSLISGADVFMFPTFYEGFGIPILEAQSVGVPVVTSNVSSMPEVAADAAIFVDPSEPAYIAQRTAELLADKDLREDMIKKGYENVKRFGWNSCAHKIANLMKNGTTK